MTTPDRILAIARGELGTVEARDGSNPYGRAYGMDRVAWCMQFCWWVFRQAGASELIHPKTAYTPAAAQWFIDRGRFDKTPRSGDLVFFNWPDSVNRIQHVGLVEAVESAAVVTIEGNTSTSSQSDGGRVMRRRRARNASIVGYGHPAYTAAPRAATSPGDPFMALSDAEQHELLSVVRNLNFQLFSGEGGPNRPGWRTWQGGTNEQLTTVDYLRRSNVETRQLHAKLDAVSAKLDAVLAAAKAAGTDPAVVRGAILDALGGGLEIVGTAVPRQG